jgi:hypothetical protein
MPKRVCDATPVETGEVDELFTFIERKMGGIRRDRGGASAVRSPREQNWRAAYMVSQSI